ncbi:hypothetical protein Tco_0462710 [Tanacetum coccineum]
MPCITSNVELPKVSVFERYAIEVESIPPNQRNNRDVHYHYLNHLRDTLDTLHEIVEKARSNNTTNPVKHPTIQKTNVPIIHSTGVSNATKTRRFQSKSNKMNDKTLPANCMPEKKVEDHHRK